MTQDMLFNTDIKSFVNRKFDITSWLTIIKNMTTPVGQTIEEAKYDKSLYNIMRYSLVPQKLTEIMNHSEDE